ncbi:Vesicle-associated membrane protein 1 [Pteropus alecto]|uniref:Vesicle-associated membrane protein 1 n=1 Tax=Pteropus alecto TaxID=9402 RepID=L5KFE8_PTEAL|nr:Vesicle-associated membrane protein 1 [Pteropus alecto]
MAHCSSCSYAGNYYRAPPPDLATHLGMGVALHFCTGHSQHPTGRAGARWSHIHCTLSSLLVGTSFRSAPAQPPTEGEEGTAPGGGPPGPPPNTSSNRRLQQTQAQVEEVVDIMRVNVDKVLKRDEILSELDDRADALQVGASQFESSAAKLKRKYWWKNCKMMIMLGAICAIIVVVIVSKYR